VYWKRHDLYHTVSRADLPGLGETDDKDYSQDQDGHAYSHQHRSPFDNCAHSLQRGQCLVRLYQLSRRTWRNGYDLEG
jgi:hypothetical protein